MVKISLFVGIEPNDLRAMSTLEVEDRMYRNALIFSGSTMLALVKNAAARVQAEGHYLV